MASFTKSVTAALGRIAPLRYAEKWDNVGLLIEAPKPRLNASNILLTIDLTPAVLQEAISEPKTGFIVAYHPPLFRPLSSLTLANPLQASLLRCVAEGISIYSPHTALDCVQGGINDWLASGVLGNSGGDVSVLGEVKDEGVGVGRLVSLDSEVKGLDIETLTQRIKSFLSLGHVEVASPLAGSGGAPQTSIRSVALCAGSGGSVLNGVDADVYFTGEMSHHEVLAAVANGKHVVLCGHTNTERGYLPTLAQRLTQELASDSIGPLEVIVSKADAHPLRLVQ